MHHVSQLVNVVSTVAEVMDLIPASVGSGPRVSFKPMYLGFIVISSLNFIFFWISFFFLYFWRKKFQFYHLNLEFFFLKSHHLMWEFY